MVETIAENPLQRFLDTPIALVYRLKDGKINVMTNGAWTWFSKVIQGTIHEFGNHSFTYEVAENITHMSMIFLPPTKESVEKLLYFGSTHGDEVNKFEKFGWDSELLIDNEDNIYHEFYPTWCLKPIDFHQVKDLFKLVTTEFICSYNGYPHERIIDEHGVFSKLVKEEIK